MAFFDDKRVIPFRTHATLTGTSTTSIVAATSGCIIYPTKVIATNSGTTTNTLVNLQFSSEGTNSFLKQLAYGGSGFRHSWDAGECQSQAGDSLIGSLSVAVNSVEVDIYGYVTRA